MVIVNMFSVIKRGCFNDCTTSRSVSGWVLPLLCCCTICGLMISCTMKTPVVMTRKLKILVPSPLIPGLSSLMGVPVSLWFAGASVRCVSSCSTLGTIRNFGTISLQVTWLVAVETKAFILLPRLLFTVLHLTTICRVGYTLLFLI